MMKQSLSPVRAKGNKVGHPVVPFAKHVARTLAFLLVACLWLPGHGQIYKYIGLEEGLSSRNVYAVQQSNGGFIWCLTDKGIDRYDGTEMNRYSISIDGVKFTEYSSCRLIYDSLKDNLWVVTGGGKIIRYVQRNNNFEPVYSPKINNLRADIMRCAVSPIDEEGT